MECSKYIDRTFSKPESTRQQIDKIISEVKAYHSKSICVNPTHVKYASEQPVNSDILICTVTEFPLGAITTVTKISETENTTKDGASEIDMVINIGTLKDRRYGDVQKDVEGVVGAANGKIVKVITETILLTDDEKVRTSELAKAAGTSFVRTSTGFAGLGATPENMKLVKDTVGDELEVKASGGTRNLEDFHKMLNADATRVGTSAGVQVIKGLESNSDY